MPFGRGTQLQIFSIFLLPFGTKIDWYTLNIDVFCYTSIQHHVVIFNLYMSSKISQKELSRVSLSDVSLPTYRL